MDLTNPAAFIPTLDGVPIAAVRPATPEERALLEGWLSRRKREALWWGPAWAMLIGCLALGLGPLALAPFLGPRVVPAFAALAILAGVMALYGTGLEILLPVARWRQVLFAGALLALGISFAWRVDGEPNALLLGLATLVIVPGGIAVLLLRTLDRKRGQASPRKVRRDLARGDVWVFRAGTAPEIHEAVVLPESRLMLRRDGCDLPGVPPVPVAFAAPPPSARYEVPGHPEHFPPSSLVPSYRLMTEPEKVELARIVKRLPVWSDRRFLAGLAVTLLVGGRTLLPEEAGVPAVLGILTLVPLLWAGFRLRTLLRLRKRLDSDLRMGRLGALRPPGESPRDAPPALEFLLTSRAIWTLGGRTGMIRRDPGMKEPGPAGP